MPIRGSNLPYVKHSFAQLKTFFITSCLFSFFFFLFPEEREEVSQFFFLSIFSITYPYFSHPSNEIEQISKGSSNNTPYPLPLPDSLFNYISNSFFRAATLCEFPSRKSSSHDFSKLHLVSRELLFQDFRKTTALTKSTENRKKNF